MKMSERNKLLIELQEKMKAGVADLVSSAAADKGILFSREEIKGALQHVSNTYTK